MKFISRTSLFSFRLFLVLFLVLGSVVVWQPAGEAVAAPVEPAPMNSGAPQLILTKTVDDNITTAQVGDVIRYRIRWECSSLTTACGAMEITDVLQSGLEYLPPPNSSVPSGFDINYNGGTRTVTITKTDNNLLDGTQYDAVIAVRVSMDFRPLPATINNTVNGRIDPPGPIGWTNATPASAPPITIGPVSPSWSLTKTRVAPVIEPTVDTDVTYRLQLCPVPPGSGGIAALSNITLTDTLPAGAVFVAASNGGTYSSGVVTWPTVAGPLYPPDCITRFVTIRYPSPTFSIGDNITNAANLTSTYTDSNGNGVPFNPGTTQITHEIDPIADVPTYSKSDAGDPVGITGTGRFILELNTNATNYPANGVTLIDTLPPQLRVTSVTSGTWSADFNYVRAYVEYSTNYGATWTAFPGQPVLYNTNATYTAPVANITSVRWRFEHDWDGNGTYEAGLPYVWQFASRPEIRVTPRATATVADPPSGAAMPAAVVGQTYTNCAQVSRVGSGGPVTDPCFNETMTVRGDYASLRISKNETPGTPWDEWENPNINPFTSDATILPGDTLRYVLTVDLTERSSAPLVNPTIRDILPSDLIFVRAGDIRVNGTLLSTAYPAATVTFTRSGPNPGAGQTLLWEINNLTIPQQALGSQVLTLEFFARIPRGQLPGTRTNDMFVVTDSMDVLCEIGTQTTDGSDVDGDSNAAEPACQTTDNYIVDRSAALRGEKWIRSTAAVNSQVVNKDTFLPDASCPNGGTSGLPGSSNPFTRFPCISQAYPEGALNPGQYVSPPPGAADLDDFEYQLRIFNDGNVPMLNYVLYDILPFYGDRGSGGTLFNSSRDSEFRPVMTGPIQFLGGAGLSAGNFTIEYSTSTNPCRPEVFNQSPGDLVPAGCSNTWIPSAATTGWTAADWATVRAYRIRLNSGITIAPYIEGDPTNIVRFGVPMSIPADSPVVGVFNNDDAQSREIAWNSFSHVGSYTDVNSNIRDLLASEPRKVGITIPERFSIGNRVWRDADNSGTINAADDVNPGIAGVTVNLYLASNTTTPIATTTTDSGGYYLFSNLPAGNYVVGIPASNFASGGPLYTLRSSTGTPPSATYTNPPDGNPDRADHGIDPATPGNEVFSPVITLSANAEPVSESDLSSNDRDGPPGTRRGRNGERDANSDLTVDFGFFGGTDVPFSIGNHLWFDNGAGGGTINDGIRQSGEPPVVGARVDLYRDGNLDGNLTPDELIRFDITDANGFYLFDNLDPGSYYVVVSAGNFTDSFDPDGAGPLPAAPGVLRGWYSSQPTGTELVGVNGGTTIADIDSDDNGVNADFPETSGVRSGVIVLQRGVSEPTGETHLSGQPDPGSPANAAYNPTGWDGPNSRGRFGETDENSNLTIDFGFIPPMSLGNRVWFDSGAGETVFRSQYNNGIQDGTEPGVANVRVELWRDNGDGVFNATTDTFLYFTTTDAQGYYLFQRLQPGDYFVHIPASNFASGSPLHNYISSYDRTPPADDATDVNDNGVDAANPASTGVTSQRINMAYNSEPLTPGNETDINNSGTYGPNNRGTYGQTDANSNLTIDFGFVRPPRSIGNYLWFDTGTGANTNNGIFDAGEQPVAGARVNLYRDNNNDGIPDDLGVIGDRSDDWIAWDVTDSNGYYLFDNLPPGRYIVGVDPDNFDAGGSYSALLGYTSSTNHVDNATNNTDSRDNGRDPLNPTTGYGVISTTINLTAIPLTGMPTGETGSGDTSTALGFNPTAGDGPNSRGRFGETDANSDLTIDFGFVEAYALGNRVWFDTNNNSTMDAGEVGVDNVLVALYFADASGNPTTPVLADGVARTTTTNASGYYLFDFLPPGNYVVVLPASNFTGAGRLNGYWSSATVRNNTNGNITETAAPDPDDDVDLDDNGTRQTSGAFNNAVISRAVTLGPNGLSEPTNDDDLDPVAQHGSQPDGRSNLTVDFGFYRGQIGNLVFEDVNLNGVYDAGDVVIAGATVQLYQRNNTTLIATATTDASGLYLFNGLPQGEYIVRVSGLPAALGVMVSTIDTNPQNDNDNPNWNVDNNDNGIGTGTVPVSSPTAAANLFILTPGGGARPDSSAKPNVTVSNANGTTTDLTVDFGFVRAYSLGNRVWFDTNNNSTLDAGEVGVNGVRVELYRDTNANGVYDPGTDTFLAFTTTANNGGVPGYYRFDNLFPGEYLVVIPADNFRDVGAGDTVPGDPLRGYWSSGTSWNSASGAPAEGVTPDPDNDADNDDNGVTTFSGAAVNYVASYAITLGGQAEPTNDNDPATNPQTGGEAPNNRSNRTVDFGFYRVAIGNLVFRDNDISGHFNTGDTPAVNVAVRLYDSAGNQIPVGPDGILGTADDAPGGVLTNASGLYQFSGLPAGSYRVEVTLPAGVRSTIDTNPQNDNDNPNWNVDNNDNGDGLGVGVVTSDAVNFLVMTPGGGTRPDSSAKPNITVSNATGTTTDNTVDFGYIDLVAIGNRVWRDTGATPGNTNNGRFDSDEAGVDGVTVVLHGAGLDGVFGTADDITQTTTTAGGGYYFFDNLIPGLYYVEIPASQFQPGGPLEGYLSSTGAGTNETSDEDVDENGIDTTPASPPAVSGVRTQNYNLQPNTERTGENQSNYTGALDDDNVNFTADFGFVQAYALGNRVWFDTNNNSLMDAGEQPVANVLVELYRADSFGNPTGAALASATTNAGGYYLFDYLTPGDYVVVLPASNFTGTGALVGYWSSGTTLQSDGSIAETPAPDADDTPVDADDNGTRQTSGAFSNAVISRAVTLGPDGLTEPTGEAASQLDSAVGQGAQPDGRANMTVDFGFYRVSVGNLVYTDGDENGNYDGGPLDAPLPGITVRLYAADGVTEIPVGPDGILGTADDGPGGVVTDAGGNYRFDGLPQGDYIVRVVAPPSTTSTIDTYNAADSANPNTNADNNDNGLGTGAGTVSSAVFTLTPGANGALNNNTVTHSSGSTHNPTIDFGFIPQYALGNRVWFDTNNNRQIDAGEVGIDGVTVELYRADTSGNPTGAVLATTTTVNGGYYLFNNLASGDYVVVIPASNFATVLNGYWSSGTTRNNDGSLAEITAPDPDNDADSDDNGIRQTSGTFSGAVISQAVTLGLGPVEPTGETDLDGGTQGQPDARANMTVDFGFYTIRLGNQVWNDTNNNGLLDGGETGIDGVTVQLWSADGSTLLATTTTSGGGIYTFAGLPQGSYIVRLPQGNFQGTGVLRDYYSSTGGGTYEPAPNPDVNTTDSDDNGTEVGSLGFPGGYIQSSVFALTPAAEQTTNNADGSTTEFRVDFGVYNEQRADLSVTKDDGIGYYLPGGTLTYTIVVSNDGPADVTGALVTDTRPSQILSWEWVCTSVTGGATGCDGYGPGSADFSDTVNLPVGSSITYTVNVTIAAAATGTLNNTVTVTPPTGVIETDPSDNSDTDSDRDAILSIEKDDGLTTVAPGTVITYTLNVTNVGLQDLTAVRVTDTLPTEVTFQSAVPAPSSISGSTLEWSGISLASGASTTITVTVRVNDNAVGPNLLNSVTVADDAIPGLTD
ncbi:MAG: SpaA isopeptide-forming pilin-related protein, partial [Anaerolineales bacterium]|nr:SpaA isopeptide-forming pilin-related protein [Anaerolineales bacterium]